MLCVHIGGACAGPRVPRPKVYPMLRSRVSAAALLLVAVAGCGGGDTASQADSQNYCDSLKTA